MTTWRNGPSGGTPISADELNRLEAAITDAATDADMTAMDARMDLVEAAAISLDSRLDAAEAELLVTPALVKGPIIPPAAQFTAAAATNVAWFATTRGILQRFTIDAEYRITHAVIPAGAAGGNCEVSIHTVVRTSTTAFNTARVGTSGVIATPAVSGGIIMVNFASSPIILAPGSYAVGLWFSTIGPTVAHGTSTPLQGLQMSLTDSGGASGIPSTLTGATTTNRYVAIALESAT